MAKDWSEGNLEHNHGEFTFLSNNLVARGTVQSLVVFPSQQVADLEMAALNSTVPVFSMSLQIAY